MTRTEPQVELAPTDSRGTVTASDLGQVRAALELPGVRWLGAGDGHRLVELVRACYGDSYSYASLYQPDAIEALWAHGSLLSLGYVDEVGQLDGHTGFWRKDPKQEYVESGLSLIRPGARRGFGVDPVLMWRALLERWSRATGFIHQNTTTRHTRAQLYAARYMRARPTGWVFDYALGETLVGLVEEPAPMHALTMSTALRPDAEAPQLAVPEGRWAGWLTELVRGVLPTAVVVPVTCSSELGSLWLEPIEHNPSLELRRRVVMGIGGAPAPAAAAARVELVHLPMRAALVSMAWASLLAGGYVPVGVRPHLHRDSEIVLQSSTLAHGRAAIASMSLAGPLVHRLAGEWLEACGPTS
jgi:hypothetical protein